MNRLLFSVVFLIVVVPIPGVTQTQGAWKHDSTKDDMTDEVQFYISATSRPTLDDRGNPLTGTIAWRCGPERDREVFIILDKYFAGNDDDQVLVETRFDSMRSDSAWWDLSRDKSGVFIPTENISAFTDRIKRSTRLLVRVTDPLDGEAITYSFNLVGFTTAYHRLEPKCRREEDAVRSSRDPSGLSVDPALDQVFMESAVDERPEMLSRPRLEYPDLLRQAKVQGRVLVQAIIDTSGRAEPASVKVIQSPNPGFDMPAKQMVLKALFRPGRVHGRAVRVLLNLPIDFTIKR